MSKSLKYGSHDFPSTAGFTRSCEGGPVQVRSYQRGGRVGEAASKGLTGAGPTGTAVKPALKAKTTMPKSSSNAQPVLNARQGRGEPATRELASAGGKSPLMAGYRVGGRVR